MHWFLAAAIALIALFFSGFFSGAETGLYRINRLRLHLGAGRREPEALRLAKVLHDESGALCVTLVGTNVANYLTTLAVAYLFADLWGLSATDTEVYTVAIVTPVVFVFGEMVPKNLFRLHADLLLARGSRLLALADRLFRLTGVVWVLTRLAAAINRLAGLSIDGGGMFEPKRRVTMLLQEALAGHALGDDQFDLIDRACRVSETPLHRVMVPRNHVKLIAADANRRELMRLARRTGGTWLPVHKGNPRRIVGVIKVDALLPSQDWSVVGEHMRRAVTLGPHETVATAITRLQRAGQALAIVTDRGGNMLGIVTLGDLLREVVGGLAPDV